MRSVLPLLPHEGNSTSKPKTSPNVFAIRFILSNAILCCFDNAKVLQKMLEKCNGKGLYKLFGNISVGNQLIKKTDYKLFLG